MGQRKFIYIAQALGYRFLDKDGNSLQPIGDHLIDIATIDNSQLYNDFSKIDLQVICDVNNPFFGKNGAAHVYAPQKGATIADIEYLDKGLQNLAKKLRMQGYSAIENIAGAGAAGGVGGGMIAFFQAKLVSGVSMFLELLNLEKTIQDCDIVITGEGKLDAQTEQGKVISGICALAKKHQKPVIAVCGAAENAAAQAIGVHRVFTVLERSNSLEEAMSKTAQKLIEIGVEIMENKKEKRN